MSAKNLTTLIGCASIIIFLIVVFIFLGVVAYLGLDIKDLEAGPGYIGLFLALGAGFGSKAILKRMFKSRLTESEKK